MRKKKKLLAAALLMVFLVGVTACGSAADGLSSITEAKSVDSTNGSDLYYEESYESEWDDSAVEDTGSVSDNRKLIKTVDLTAETYEFDALVANVESRVAALGGYMESASIHTRYSDLKYGDFIIRIPVNKLDQFVTEFAEMSNITDKETTQKDVTLSYVDLESHKAALEAEETSLLKLLENATSIEDIIALQSRLTDVRYQIESMESQLRTMDNLIDYATINLYIDEVETYTPQEEPSMGDRISSGFKNSLDEIGTGFKNLIVYVIVKSPYLVIGAIIIVVTILIVRLIIKAAIKKGDENEAKRAKEMQERMQQNGK